MPQINAERLLADLHALRDIGRYKTGVHRPTFSPDDIRSRHWLADRLTEAGSPPPSTASAMSSATPGVMG
jgi:N-carbamoyl-L-amino-acid hydrolase